MPLLKYSQFFFSLSFAKGVYSGVVDGITDETPSLISFIGKAMLESFPNGPGEALAQIWDYCPGGVDATVLRVVRTFWKGFHLSGD